MHVKERYTPVSESQVHELIRRNPLAAVVGLDSAGLTANHLPLILDPEKGPNGTLIGHMARANSQGAALQHDPRVLAVFMGPSGYVSSSWYKRRDSAPTWNYAAVHCHGRLRFATDSSLTVHALQMLVDRMEEGRADPWNMSELGDEGIRVRLSQIIGFEIAIESIEAKFQMSQYERSSDTRAAIAALRREGRYELAESMLRWSGTREES